MHLVLIAWLYLIGMIALTASSAVAGLMLFVLGGLGPVLLAVAWLGARVRRRRAQASAGSALEHDVNDRDDRDPEADQRELARGLDGLGPSMQAGNEVGNRDVKQARSGDREHER